MDSADPSRHELVAHQSELRRLARRLAADPHLADDLLQDVNLIALEPGRSRAKDLAWLKGVLRKLFLNRVREEGRRKWRELRSAAPREHEVDADPTEFSRVLRALQRIEEPYRSTLCARFVEGSTPAELAARSNVPIRTIHTRTTRGLARLRAELRGSRAVDRSASLFLLVRRAGPALGVGAAACITLIWFAGGFTSVGSPSANVVSKDVASAPGLDASIQVRVLDSVSRAPRGPSFRVDVQFELDPPQLVPSAGVFFGLARSPVSRSPGSL